MIEVSLTDFVIFVVVLIVVYTVVTWGILKAINTDLKLILNNQVIIDKNVKVEGRLTREYASCIYRILREAIQLEKPTPEVLKRIDERVRQVLASVNPNAPALGRKVEIPEKIARMRIEELDFSVRTYNCLKRPKEEQITSNNEILSPITTVGDLAQWSPADLMQIRYFGKKSLSEVREKLNFLGVTLYKDPFPDAWRVQPDSEEYEEELSPPLESELEQ